MSEFTSLYGNVAIVKEVRQKVTWGISTDEFVPVYISGDGKVLSETLPMRTNTDGSISHYSLVEDRALVYDGQKERWGYRDEKCKLVIPFKYRGAWSFTKDGLAVARDEEGKYGYINTQGEWVIELQYSVAPEGFHSGRAMIYDKAKMPYIIDRTGNIVWKVPTPSIYTWYMIHFFDNGLGVYYDADAEKTYIIDPSFNKVAVMRKFEVGTKTARSFLAEGEDWWHYKCFDTHYIYDFKGNLLLEYFSYSDSSGDNGINFILDNENGGNTGYYFNTKGEVIALFQDTQF